MTNHGVIRIKNAVFYAYHGVGKDEQNLGGKFEVDVDLRIDFSAAVKSDSLKQTVNYEQVYSLVKTLVNEKKYNLIETLAETIADGILEKYLNINEVSVRLRKPHPPVKGVVDYVEVEVTRNRK
jgi:7,8-dihydroneopterin aldolase/epimerase/oxygenase